ncbi:MAG: acyl-CoA dehydratase activase, partial [Planctomycetota bacterium]
RPIAAATALLEEIVEATGRDAVRGLRLTGSGARAAAATLEAPTVNEFRAAASGLAATGTEATCVFEMGGEASKYLLLERSADGYDIADYATNGDCAAGTGAFLDQQAGRLRYDIEEVGDVVLGADRAAGIAGRCSVFAKSDMIHAQQKGYTPAEVLRGLCDAVARNFRAAVVRSHPVTPPVALIGGVAANQAVVQAMRRAFQLGDDELFVPEAYAHVPAIGAAAEAARAGENRALSHLAALRAASDTAGDDLPTQEPLALEGVVLLRDRQKPYTPPPGDEPIDVYLGLDVGSVSTNVVAIDPDGQVVAEIYTRTRGRPIEVVTDALAQIQRQWGDRLRVCGAGATGSGRELVGALVGADTVNDEITAHKTGATFVGLTMLDGRTPETIFEIGGQDSKFISLDRGVVVDFTMNDACAAGTGSFLEERAEELEIAIKEEFAELALSSEAPVRLGERCTVFMERDVNSYMQRGAETRDLVAGLAYSVVYNYINRVVRGRHIGETIFFQGGTAYNDAVAAAFARVTGKQIIVPPHNGVVGAIGAALLAKDKMTHAPEVEGRRSKVEDRGSTFDIRRSQEHQAEGTYVSDEVPAEPEAGEAAQSAFRGWDMSKVDYALREFTCKGCSNHCCIQQFTVDGEKTYWGDKCSDRYRKRAKTARKAVIEDLFALREGWLLDESDLPVVGDEAPRVGIPRAMFALEQLPFWRTLLGHLGYRTVLSDQTNARIVRAGGDAVVAEPCFPIIVAHGHVADLEARNVDFILLPNIVSMETQWLHTESHVCPWHQTLPFVARRAPKLRHLAKRFWTPTVRFREGRPGVCRTLQAFFKPLGRDRKTVSRAVRAAFSAQDRFEDRRLAAGREAIETLRDAGEPAVVIVGRPYNVHDAGVNLAVPRKLREQYGVNCIPLDFLDIGGVSVRDLNQHMYWSLGRKILAAARLVGRYENFHIIHITNFKCGPDSFIKHFIGRACGAPFLTLQMDAHSNDAGVMTRCEAYLDSKGILRPWRNAPTQGERQTAALA